MDPRAIESALGADVENAQNAQDLEAVRLSMQAEVAINYFALRVTDVQSALYVESLKSFEASLKVTRNRYEAGVAARLDVVLGCEVRGPD